MAKPRIYIDTSVIGGCYDEEFSEWSNRLIAEIRKILKIAVISSLTQQELVKAPENVREVLRSLPDEGVEYVFLTEEAENLAQMYIKEGVVRSRHILDAQHIAIATVVRVDLLVSWNFQQIVNLHKIHHFNAVNLKLGYPVLEIRSPREVIHEKEV